MSELYSDGLEGNPKYHSILARSRRLLGYMEMKLNVVNRLGNWKLTC